MVYIGVASYMCMQVYDSGQCQCKQDQHYTQAVSPSCIHPNGDEWLASSTGQRDFGRACSYIYIYMHSCMLLVLLLGQNWRAVFEQLINMHAPNAWHRAPMYPSRKCVFLWCWVTVACFYAFSAGHSKIPLFWRKFYTLVIIELTGLQMESQHVYQCPCQHLQWQYTCKRCSVTRFHHLHRWQSQSS